MSELQYLREHTVHEARKELNYKGTILAITQDVVFFDELEKLIKSHDLVEENGGFELLCKKYRSSETICPILLSALKDVHSFTP